MGQKRFSHTVVRKLTLGLCDCEYRIKLVSADIFVKALMLTTECERQACKRN